MRKIFAFSLMAALVLASCASNEQFAPTPRPDGKTIRATIESATRTTMVEDGDVYHIYWKAGDKIRCTDDGEGTLVIYETADNGVASANFTWSAESGTQVLSPDSLKFWAYYPAVKKRALPAVQQYAPNGLAAAPMRGYYERTAEEPFAPAFDFKHLCGAIKLNLTTSQADVKVVSIVLRADNGLSGSYGSGSTGTYYDQVVSSADSPATLDCPEVAIGTDPVPFFISVPPYTYKAFTITVLDSQGRTQTRSLKEGEELVIERAQVRELDLAFDNLQKPSVGATATFTKGPDMNAAIKALVNPDISAYTEDDSTVTKMVFVTNSDTFSAVNIADPASESPIYVLYDEATTTITVTTPAPKFVLNANTGYFFHRFKALTQIEGIEDFDTSNAENWAYFWGYSPLTSITMPATWDYSSLNSATYMFVGSAAETVDVSHVNFEKVTTMAFMFSYMDNLSQVIWPNEVDTPDLTAMNSMFRYSAISRVDLSSFVNTSGVTNMRYMFASCPNIQKVIMDCDMSGLVVTGDTAGLAFLFSAACENSGTLDLSEMVVSSSPTFRNTFRETLITSLDLSTWSLESVDPTAAAGLVYMFYRSPRLSTLYLGPDFIYGKSPSNMWGGTSDTVENGTGILAGAMTIYCTQETADWLAGVTILYKIHTGAYCGTPVPVTFYDILNPSIELNVTWRTS